MKRHTIPSLPAVILMITLFASCQNVETETTYPAEIQGWVYDDSTKQPINAALLTSMNFTLNAYTNDSGRFYQAKIELPRSEYNSTIICSKEGYTNDTLIKLLKSDQLNTIDTILIKKSSK